MRDEVFKRIADEIRSYRSIDWGVGAHLMRDAVFEMIADAVRSCRSIDWV